MSHIVELETQFDVSKQSDCLRKACKRIGAECLGQGSHMVFGNNYDGFGIKLSGWNYPIVVEKSGNVKYDNYNGKWGETKQLDKLKQAYAVEVAKKAARKQGKSVVERAQKDGSIRLEVSV